MEIEAEHYTNGVVEGSSARIMNGTYKHEEILQTDDNSIGNGVAGTNTHTHTYDKEQYSCNLIKTNKLLHLFLLFSCPSKN